MTALFRAYLLEFHAAPESLMECLGWTVVHSLWQGVVWAAVLAVILSIPMRCRAEIRHQWALGMMLAFLAGVWLTFVSLLPRADGVLQESRPGLTAAASWAAAPALAPMESPGTAVAVTDPGTQPAGVSIPPRSASRWQEWVAWGWISVVGSLLVWRIFGWMGIIRIRRQSSPASGVLADRFDLLSKKLGIRRRIPLVIHDRLRGVFLCGVFRPFVVVPAALANGMPLSEMEALLTHELVHWKRRDPWLKMAQTICELLLCHHPATWWMSRQINLAREMAADDLAVEHLGHREIYARALVHAAEWNARLSPALGATGTGLPARLARLMRPAPAPSSTPGMGMLATAVATVMILVLLERAAIGQESVSPIQPGESIQEFDLQIQKIRIDEDAQERKTATTGAATDGKNAPAANPESQGGKNHFPTTEESAAAAALVQKFLAADSIEEKLQLVRFPEKVKPLMEQWYTNRPHRSIKAHRDDLAESLSKVVHADGLTFIIVIMLHEPENGYHIYAVESTSDGGLKVDWETAVGWQAVDVGEFMKQKLTTPQPFRLQAAPGDHYNGAYSDASVWLAVNLTFPLGNPDVTLYGYVERNTRAGHRLMELLGYSPTRDDNGTIAWELVQATSTPLVLSLAYPKVAGDPKQVTIHEILGETWFLKDGPAASVTRKTEPPH